MIVSCRLHAPSARGAASGSRMGLRSWRTVVELMEALRKRLGLASGRVLIVVVAVAALVVAGGVAAAVRVQSASGRILAGVRIDGVDVGGMTREQALAAVRQHVAPMLSSKVAVLARGGRWHVTPSGLGRTPKIDQAVDRALDGPGLSLLSDLWHRVSGRPVSQQTALEYTGNARRVASFVDSVGSKVDVTPRDASITLVEGEVDLRHSRAGLRLDQTASERMVAAALRSGRPTTVKLPTRALRPDRSDAEAGTTITVDLSTNTLRLYQGLKLVKTYPVATARAGFATPRGTWHVMSKLVNPSWHNPDPTGWGAGMPLVIPPGPGNPLGTRALALDAAGILIHGSYASGSIGSYASHGCIRMQIWDAEDLVPRVPVDAQVLIYRS
jgi:lipoprotein-anchoring transpeptidase ErfK/SrfK